MVGVDRSAAALSALWPNDCTQHGADSLGDGARHAGRGRLLRQRRWLCRHLQRRLDGLLLPDNPAPAVGRLCRQPTVPQRQRSAYFSRLHRGDVERTGFVVAGTQSQHACPGLVVGRSAVDLLLAHAWPDRALRRRRHRHPCALCADQPTSFLQRQPLSESLQCHAAGNGGNAERCWPGVAAVRTRRGAHTLRRKRPHSTTYRPAAGPRNRCDRDLRASIAAAAA